MTIAQTGQPSPRKPLRLWPGVAAAVLLGLTRFVLPIVMPEDFGYAILGGLVWTLAILVWWLFFSRAPWSDRLGAVALMIVARVGHIALHPRLALQRE